MDWYWWFILFFVVVGIYRHYKAKWRKARLMKKYRNEGLVNKLMEESCWQGQTEGQLLDSLGRPSVIEESVMKTRVKETWKYNKTGKDQYATSVILENGLVVGWDSID